MLLGCEPGLMIEQSVENVRRLAGGCGDHLGVEGPVLVRDMGVERHARLVAVPRVDVGDRLAVAPGEEMLAVGAGCAAIAPDAGERQRPVRVDDLCKRFGVGRFRDVPVLHQAELA